VEFLLEYRNPGVVKTAKTHDSNTVEDEATRETKWNQRLAELADELRNTKAHGRSAKEREKLLKKARDRGMAYLANDGGRGLRTVIWRRVEGLLQRHRNGHSSVVMRAVVDGDITGPTTDDLTIVISRDYDPGLIGSLLIHGDAGLIGVVSVGPLSVRSYDGVYSYVTLMGRLFPLLVARMEAAGEPVGKLAARWGDLPPAYAFTQDIKWARAILACVSEQVQTPPSVLKDGQPATIWLSTLAGAVDKVLSKRNGKELCRRQLRHHPALHVLAWWEAASCV